MELDTIVCRDCLGVMKDMPDGCVDAIITDPPYGLGLPKIGKNYGNCPNKSRKASDETWDDGPPSHECFVQMMRVSKEQIIFGGNFFLDSLPSTRCYIVWDKRGDLPPVPFSPVEWAWTSYNKMPKLYTVRNHGFIRDSREPRVHPTQKPLLLMMKIIEDFTQPGDLIFDPFMGSGTTAVAALKLDRHFYGCDISEEYVGLANERIEKARLEMAQLKFSFLFEQKVNCDL